MQITAPTLTAFEAVAKELAKTVTPKTEGATLITLSGELGAGKTAFVKAFARALGVTEDVTSPTFILSKTYELSNQSFARLVHIDAYRLDDGAGLAPLRFGELLLDSTNLILLEWPEQVQNALPKADSALTITVEEDGTRHISYE